MQDLAVSPKIQDPQLNTVECVIEGHKPNISATGRSAYILAMLGFSVLFTILSGPFIALVTLIILNNAKGSGNRVNKKRQAIGKALEWNLCLILLVEIGLLVTVFVFLGLGNVSWDIYLIPAVIFIEGLILGVVITNEKCDFEFLSETEWGLRIAVFLSANLTAYHFCWLVIGVMINALWGVIVLLFVCIFIAASIFAFYNYFLHTPSDQCSWKNCILGAVFILSVWLLAIIVILAGQSFFGKETANDVVKALTLYVTTAFASWMLPKVPLEKSNTPLTNIPPPTASNRDS